MMKLTSRTAAQAALSLALLFVTAATTHAQKIVSAGSGTYQALSIPETLHFSYFVRDMGNGSASGLAMWKGPKSTTLIRVTSFGFFELTPGTRSLAFAGEIVAIQGTPPPGARVGGTAFTAMNDNGRLAADGTASLSFVPPLSALPPLPPQLGTLSTIQQIVTFLRLVNAPPPRFQPLISGNIWTR